MIFQMILSTKSFTTNCAFKTFVTTFVFQMMQQSGFVRVFSVTIRTYELAHGFVLDIALVRLPAKFGRVMNTWKIKIYYMFVNKKFHR